MKGEIWKDIEGYEGLYEVSSMGRVRSLGNGKSNYSKERILKGRDNGQGYLFVHLSKDGKKKKYYIHRLVGQVFLENPNNLPTINHKDENKQNNCVQNLEWCDYSYNLTYNGRAKKVAEKLSKPVFSVDKDSGLIMWWESIMEAERCTGINSGNISKCCKGKLNSAGNHYWFYADADDDNE